MKGIAATLILFCLIAGHEPPADNTPPQLRRDSVVAIIPQATPVSVPDTLIKKIAASIPMVETGNTDPLILVQYAKSLIGTPYRYGSTDPQKGFDCSGFITYVFNHFNIKVPRSSVEFVDVGRQVNYQAAKTGDLILFTGTDSTIRVIGHMGIVVSNEDNQLQFIHSTSGKIYGVTITPLNAYYMSRFVKVTRIFPDDAYVRTRVVRR